MNDKDGHVYSHFTTVARLKVCTYLHAAVLDAQDLELVAGGEEGHDRGVGEGETPRVEGLQQRL